jgi:hypothetical protein
MNKILAALVIATVAHLAATAAPVHLARADRGRWRATTIPPARSSSPMTFSRPGLQFGPGRLIFPYRWPPDR